MMWMNEWADAWTRMMIGNMSSCITFTNYLAASVQRVSIVFWWPAQWVLCDFTGCLWIFSFMFIFMECGEWITWLLTNLSYLAFDYFCFRLKRVVLCGVENCENPKRYSCSKTGIPLCSLECYRKNLTASDHSTVTNMPTEIDATWSLTVVDHWTLEQWIDLLGIEPQIFSV